MRMHSTCGKCGSNIILGALLIFSVIVLYNYWTISTVNKDLLLRIHTLEQQAISLSKSKEALQSNIEKTKEEKSDLELSLHHEQNEEAKLTQHLQQKESSNKDLQRKLESAKKSSQDLRDELESQKETSQKEISELKEKVVSLEAQVAEKTNTNEELQEQLESTKKLLEKEEKLVEKLKQSSPSTSAKSTTKAEDPLAQPVLLNDPAVPYPEGWMDPSFSHLSRQIQISDVLPGHKGIIGHGGPVIIFDPPMATKSKARFSVLDPPKRDSVHFRPEQQMNPEVIHSVGSPLKSDTLPVDTNNAAELGELVPAGGGRDSVGVLPIPGAGGGENLDAAEDDVPVKEDGADQSPDGTLSAKEIKDSVLGVGPAPPPVKSEPEMGDNILGHGGQSGQDGREAAHLSDQNLHNTL